jgi:lipopolysaccharide export system protein LptC
MTRNTLIAWLPVGLVLLLAVLTFWLMRAVAPAPATSPGAAPHLPDIVLENFTARQLGIDGKERYTLAANKMRHFRDDDSTELEKVDFSALEKNEPPLRVEASRARLTSKADEIFFFDKVLVVREPEGEQARLTAETTYLHVTPDAGMAKTDRPVVIKQGNSVVTAQGMELNNKTRVATLTKAKAIYYETR